MTEVSKVGKRGTVVIPAGLRRRFGIEEGSLVIAEAHEGGVLIRPAIALPSDEYRRQFLAEVDRGFTAFQEDQVAWQQELSERRLLEGTLMDGLDPDEMWTEDGEVVLADDSIDAGHG